MFASPLSQPTPERTRSLVRLRREVIAVLLFKTIVILLAGFFVFGAAHRLYVDADVMTQQLMR